jgi:hypothetical protein
MTDPELHPDARELIRQSLESIDHVEILLFLRASGQWTTVDDLAARHHLSARVVADCLRDLETARLVEGNGSAWRLAALPAERRAALEQLALAYDERPLLLVRALRGRPSSVLHSFADSFRLRRKD